MTLACTSTWHETLPRIWVKITWLLAQVDHIDRILGKKMILCYQNWWLPQNWHKARWWEDGTTSEYVRTLLATSHKPLARNLKIALRGGLAGPYGFSGTRSWLDTKNHCPEGGTSSREPQKSVKRHPCMLQSQSKMQSHGQHFTIDPLHCTRTDAWVSHIMTGSWLYGKKVLTQWHASLLLYTKQHCQDSLSSSFSLSFSGVSTPQNHY